MFDLENRAASREPRSSFQISRIKEGGLETIHALAILHTQVPSEWRDDWNPAVDLSEAVIQGEMQKLSEAWGEPHQLILVAESKSQIIGYHWATCTPLAKRIRDMPYYSCRIHGLWVHPQWRRRGIARAFKQELETWAKSMGCSMIFTETHFNGLGVRELNESLGYEVIRYVMRKRI